MRTHRIIQVFVGLAILFGSYSQLAAQAPAPTASWRDRGMQFQQTGESDSALYYLEKWTEADPTDEISWYNLSCLYALAGNRGEALDALDRAVAAGWRDADHTLADTDLQSLRGDPRFVAAMTTMRTRRGAEGPEGLLRRHLATTTLGTYIVMLPPDYDSTKRDYPVCAILHGAGSTELGHGRLADQIGRAGVIYIAPRAPYATMVGPSELGYTSRPAEQVDSASGFDGRLPDLYAAWIVSCIDDVRKHYRVESRPAALLGHSQGAAMSMITASLYPDRVRAVFAYAGYLPEQYRAEKDLDALKRRNVQFALVHGAADGVVPPSESVTASAALQAGGVPTILTMHDSTGHSISRAVLGQMTKWVDEVVRR